MSINNNDNDNLKPNCFKTINDLFEKYQDNDYMLQRIYSHIVNLDLSHYFKKI